MELMSGDEEYEKFFRKKDIEEQGILTEVVIVRIANDFQTAWTFIGDFCVRYLGGV